jgi:hypothetical protein
VKLEAGAGVHRENMEKASNEDQEHLLLLPPTVSKNAGAENGSLWLEPALLFHSTAVNMFGPLQI